MGAQLHGGAIIVVLALAALFFTQGRAQGTLTANVTAVDINSTFVRQLSLGTCYLISLEAELEEQLNCTQVRACQLGVSENQILSCLWIQPSANVINGSVMFSLNTTTLTTTFYQDSTCSNAEKSYFDSCGQSAPQATSCTTFDSFALAQCGGYGFQLSASYPGSSTTSTSANPASSVVPGLLLNLL
jgi:hypothetical protein